MSLTNFSGSQNAVLDIRHLLSCFYSIITKLFLIKIEEPKHQRPWQYTRIYSLNVNCDLCCLATYVTTPLGTALLTHELSEKIQARYIKFVYLSCLSTINMRFMKRVQYYSKDESGTNYKIYICSYLLMNNSIWMVLYLLD